MIDQADPVAAGLMAGTFGNADALPPEEPAPRPLAPEVARLIPRDTMAAVDNTEAADAWARTTADPWLADQWYQTHWAVIQANAQAEIVKHADYQDPEQEFAGVPSVDLSAPLELPPASYTPGGPEDVTKPDLLASTGQPPEAKPSFWEQAGKARDEAFNQAVPTINPNDNLLTQVAKMSQRPLFLGGGILRPDIAGGPVGGEDAAAARGAEGPTELLSGARNMLNEAIHGAGDSITPRVVTAGRQSAGELMQGIGHIDNVSPDIQADIRRSFELNGQKPEMVSWDETLNDLAPRLGETPEGLARKWNGMPRAEASTQLAIGKVGLEDYARRIAELNQKMESGVATADDMGLWADLKLRQAELMFGLRRAGGEAGRTLNILRLGLQEDSARVAERTYQNVKTIAGEATSEVAKAAENGTLSTRGKSKLEAIRTALENPPKTETGALEEAARRGRSATRKSTVLGTEKVLKEADPSLAEQLVALNRQQNKARDIGNYDLVDEIEHQRQGILGALDDKLREAELRRLEEPPERKPATLADADRLSAAKIVSTMRANIREEMSGYQQAFNKTAISGQRVIEQGMARDAIAAIDRIMNAGADNVAVRAEAKTLLDELSTVSGWADQAVRNYRETRAQAQATKALGAKPSPEVIAEFARMDWIDPRAAQVLAEKFRADPSKWEQIHAARVFSMLANTGTQLQNTMGNAMNTVYRPLVRRPVAAGIEALRTTGTKEIPAATLQEAAADLAGIAASFRTAIDEFEATATTGVSARPLRELGTRRADPIRIPGLTPLNKVGRLMAATDDFFRTLNEGGAMLAEANIVGRQRGIGRDQVLVRMTEFPEVIERGARESDRAVLQAPLTGYWKKLAGLRDNPVTQTLIPFFNTQANIARIGSDISPLGFVRDARVKGQLTKLLGREPTAAELAIEHANVRADTAVGMGLTGLGASLAAGGIINAYGPTDPSQRQAWLEAGNKPNSVMVNGEQLPLLVLGQFAIPVLIGAASVEAARAGVKHSSIEAGLTNLMHSFGRLGLEQSGMRGFDTLMNVLTGTGTKLGGLETLLENTATGGLPPGLLGQLARMGDETIRNPDTMWEAIVARIPKASEGLPAKLDRWGQTEKRELTGAGQLLASASSIGHRTDDPIRQEVLRLNEAGFDVGPSRLGKAIEGASLSNAEHDAYQKVYGEILQEKAQQLIGGSPSYENASDARRAELFEKEDREARIEAARQMKGAFPDLKDRIEEYNHRKRDLVGAGR